MSFSFQEVDFKSDGNLLKGYFYFSQTIINPSGVLFLHGSGVTVGASVFKRWQEYLATKGISTFAFDTRGVGKSSGEFKEASLNNRTKDALAAWEFFMSKRQSNLQKIYLVAISMGAHVAARLVEKLPDIKGVILSGAGAYSSEAEDKNLDSSFTEVIRKKESFLNSPAFSLYENANKPMLIVYGDKEEVIPQSLQRKYQSLNKDFVILPNSNHQSIRGVSEEDKNFCQNLFNISYNFLNSQDVN